MTGTDREARARMRIEDIVVHCALNDGTAVRLRTITPDDAPLIREGIAKLSAESRYLRFFSPAPVLPDAVVQKLADVDGHDHIAADSAIPPTAWRSLHESAAHRRA